MGGNDVRNRGCGNRRGSGAGEREPVPGGENHSNKERARVA